MKLATFCECFDGSLMKLVYVCLGTDGCCDFIECVVVCSGTELGYFG